MKFNEPKNKNYCGVVVKLKTILALENCDNVVGAQVFGFQAIIGKGTDLEELFIFFPAETRLSEAYCKSNNLFRDASMNQDKEKKGYVEKNRRIRAVKFRGHRSSCLVMPLSSVSFTKVSISDISEGDEFDEINGIEICRKHEVITKGTQPSMSKKESRVDRMHIPEHYDTEQYYRNKDKIKPTQEIIVTAKLHGTSCILSNTFVKHKMSLVDRVAQFFGASIMKYEHDSVFGSRKVIKDPNNKDQAHYYGEDLWNIQGAKYADLIPENFIVYGEYIGWTSDGAAIQSGYTYDVPKGDCHLYVYRVAIVNERGLLTDLAWSHVKQFCNDRGLKYVPELWIGKHKNFNPDKYMDKQFSTMFNNCPKLSDPTSSDEGVCIRVEGMVPKIYKSKCESFYLYETKQLDEGVVDMESAESI